MSQHHLLYLDAEQLTAFAWRSGRLTQEGQFMANAPDQESFGKYLAKNRHGRFSLLVNLAGEDYVSESIPLLWGRDRQRLITRKGLQHFPAPALYSTISLARQKTARKSETLLISALTEARQFQPWLQIIDDSEAALTGIYTTAQLSGKLLDKLGLGTPDCLLLCLFANSIRESYVHNGHTVFSRLITITDSSLSSLASNVVAEAGKLYQYLVSQRQIGRDAALPIYVLAHPQLLAEVEAAATVAPQLSIRGVDNQAAASQLKLETPPKDNCSQQLFLKLLTSATPRQQFAPPVLLRNFRLGQLRRLIWSLSCGLLAVSALSATNNLHEARTLRSETGRLLNEQKSIEHRRQDILDRQPRFEIDHEQLVLITDYYAELRAHRGDPAPALIMLSHALDQLTEIEVAGLNWQLEQLTPVGKAALRQEVLDLDGVVRGEKTGSARRVQAMIEQLSQLLRAASNCTVELSRPLFATSTLTRDAEESGEYIIKQHFSLRISCPK